MKQYWLASLVFFMICSLSVSGQRPNPSNDREEILRLYRELTDAFARRDADALNRLFADDYTMVSPRGRLILKDAYLQSRVGSGPATESVQFDQVSIRLHGTAAVVTSHFTAQISVSASATPQQQEIWRNVSTADAGPCNQRGGGNTRTDTWIKRNGSWQLAATQLSPLGFTGAREASAASAMCGVNADDLRWNDVPAFPGARIAALFGNAYNGPFAIRMQRPDGHVEQPHRHEADETVSVTSGIVHIGLGDRVDRESAKVFRPGAYVVIPARTVHYSWAEGPVVEEISWNGPAEPVPASAHTEVSLPRETLAAYAGTYRFTPGDRTVMVTLEGNRLMAQLAGAPAPFPIYPESETKFFLKSAPPGSSVGVNMQLEFVKDASGRVTGLIVHGPTDRKGMRISK